MKLLAIILALLCLNNITYAQGVRFEDQLSWQAILLKARQEKKNIFIDFMATWCAPCKGMDKDVYSSKTVVDELNSEFIMVKVQQDKTSNDNDYVKSWYNDAAELFKKYEVSSYPTLLFITPTGSILLKAVGYQSPESFIKLVKEAKDPSKQYLLLTSLKDLLRKAAQQQEFELQRTLAKYYINNYLMKMPEERIYTKSNLEFLAEYVRSSDKSAFNIFYPDASKASAILGNEKLQETVINRLVSQEIIDPLLFKDAAHTKPQNLDPNWKSIAAKIEKTYGKNYVKSNIYNAQMGWYNYSPWKNYEKAAQSAIDYFGNKPSPNGFVMNALCWNLYFAHIMDKEKLKIAANWMSVIIEKDRVPAYFDTYANLLYKSGDVPNAIIWEDKAMQLDAENAKKNNGQPNPEFTETYYKMRSGIPTWRSTPN